MTIEVQTNMKFICDSCGQVHNLTDENLEFIRNRDYKASAVEVAKTIRERQAKQKRSKKKGRTKRCKREGCNKKVLAKGLCSRHYRMQLRTKR